MNSKSYVNNSDRLVVIYLMYAAAVAAFAGPSAQKKRKKRKLGIGKETRLAYVVDCIDMIMASQTATCDTFLFLW